MPMQLEFDYRFCRAFKEHLKQRCNTTFCYFTQKTVRGMSIKDNPGTLPINLNASAPAACKLVDFSKIGEAHTLEVEPLPAVLYDADDLVYLNVMNKMCIIMLKEVVTSSVKNAKGVRYTQDPFNPLCFMEDDELEVCMKDVHGNLKKCQNLIEVEEVRNLLKSSLK